MRFHGKQCRSWTALPLRRAMAGTARDYSTAWVGLTPSITILRFPLIARRCNRAGFNAATLVAPYHFQRRPRQRWWFARLVGLPSVGGGNGAGDRRNSRPDRWLLSGRLPRCGAVGLFAGSVVCGDGGVPRCAAGRCRSGAHLRAL